jgi:RND family efflux transporter MFP subunit
MAATKSLRLTGAAAISLASSMSVAQMPPAAVVVAEAEYRSLAPTVDVPGTVISRNDARLASELAARIVWIAEVGTRVSAGDTVARLDDVTFRLSEGEAASRVTREEARVRFLKSEVARLERLAEKNNTAKSLLDQTSSELAVAESDEAIARSQLGLAGVAMAVTQIKAPFDGVVTERLRNLGERLNVADEVIRLVDPRAIEVVARAPLNTVNFVANDDEMILYNDYRRDSGTVRTIVPFGNPQSHMFELRLNIDPEKWTVGESVRLAMPTAEARKVLSVPRDALVLRREGSFVFRVNDDMSAEQINVSTGLGAGTRIEVIGEIKAGDRIVVRGAERLNTGMTVSISDSASGTGVSSSAANP